MSWEDDYNYDYLEEEFQKLEEQVRKREEKKRKEEQLKWCRHLGATATNRDKVPYEHHPDYRIYCFTCYRLLTLKEYEDGRHRVLK